MIFLHLIGGVGSSSSIVDIGITIGGINFRRNRGDLFESPAPIASDSISAAAVKLRDSIGFVLPILFCPCRRLGVRLLLLFLLVQNLVLRLLPPPHTLVLNLLDVLHTLTEYIGTDGPTADTDALVIVLLLPLEAVLEVRVERGVGSAVPSVVVVAAVLVGVLFGGRVDIFLHHGEVGGTLDPILAQVDAGDLGRLDVALPVAVAASAGIEVQPDRVDTTVVIDHGNVHHPIAVLVVQDRHRVIEVGPLEQQRELLVDFHGLLFAATGRAFRYNLRRRQQVEALPVLQEDHLLARSARGMGRIRKDRPMDAAGGAGSTAAAAAPMG